VRARTARAPVELGIRVAGGSFRFLAVNARSRTPRAPQTLVALMGALPGESARPSSGAQGARGLHTRPAPVEAVAVAESAPAMAGWAPAVRARRRLLLGPSIRVRDGLDPSGWLHRHASAPASVEVWARIDRRPAWEPCDREAEGRRPARRAAARCPPRGEGARAGAGGREAPASARRRRWRPPRASRRSATGCWVDCPSRPTTPAVRAPPPPSGLGNKCRYSRSPFCQPPPRVNTSSS
jgi:hypothetical protein